MILPRQIRAKSRSKSIVFLVISLVGLVYVLHNQTNFLNLDVVLLTTLFILIIPCTIIDLIHTVFLTETGVICYRFGCMYRTIQWKDLSQVCIIRDTNWSFVTSSGTRIVFTPIGCEKYSKEKFSGIKYLLAYQKKVAWVDNTDKNRKFIKKYYGELQNFAHASTR